MSPNRKKTKFQWMENIVVTLLGFSSFQLYYLRENFHSFLSVTEASNQKNNGGHLKKGFLHWSDFLFGYGPLLTQ